MSLNLSSLAAWNDVDDSMAFKSIEQNRLTSIPGIKIVPDVAGDVELPFASQSVSFSNLACNRTTSGQTNLGTIKLSTCQTNTFDSWCHDDLQGTALSKYFKGNLDTLPFENALAEMTMKNIEKGIENILINGNPTTTTQGALCSGFLYALNQASASTINMTSTAITSTNGIGVIDAIAANLPGVVREQEYVAVLMNYAAFDNLMIALRNANNFHYDSTQKEKYVYKMPGYTNIYVHGINSLANGVYFATFSENMAIGYNLKQSLKMWYSQDSDKYMYSWKSRLGAKFHFPDHVVYMK